MADTWRTTRGTKFLVFFSLPEVIGSTQVVAEFRMGDHVIKTDQCGARVDGGFGCSGTVPQDAHLGTYELVRLAIRDATGEHTVPNGLEKAGPAQLIVDA
jgi:hypothetical protein